MDGFLLVVCFLSFFCSAVYSGELTFELPDNERMCFYENVDKGVEATLEYQVVMGGNYDVDLQLTGPNNQILYKEVKKQYDSHTWTADYSGIHTFCFSNEFSTFTHKVVYFDLQVGPEKPVGDNTGDQATAMTLIESLGAHIFGLLTKVVSFQTFFRNLEFRDKMLADDLNSRVMLWSAGQSLLVILVAVGQVFVLRSFFTTRIKSQG